MGQSRPRTLIRVPASRARRTHGMAGDDLIFNPHATLIKLSEDGAVIGFQLGAPVKGRGLVLNTVYEQKDPKLFGLLSQLDRAEGSIVLEMTSEGYEALKRMGLFLPKDGVPEAVSFSCFLDEEPAPLVLRRGLVVSETRREEFRVSRSLCFCPDGGAPVAVRALDLDLSCFLPGSPLAWVQDPGTAVWVPYWAGGELAWWLDQCVPGAPPPRRFPEPLLRSLAQARILVTAEEEAARWAEWEGRCVQSRAAGEARGYAVLRDLIPPLQLRAVRRYYRALIERGFVWLGDQQVARRYAKYGEPLARFFHCQLTGLVGRIFGAAVKPSLAGFISYLPGVSLAAHTDREPYKYSLSLLLDYTPEPQGPSGWPLFLERKGDSPFVAKVDLALGEGLLFRGRELVHYREALPDGHRSTSFVLAYANQDFQGSLE